MNYFRLAVVGVLVSMVGLVGCASDSAEQMQRAARANADLGLAYLNQGDLGRAQEAFVKSLRADKNTVDAHAGLAYIFTQLRDWGAAEQHYVRALELRPKSPSIQNHYGVMLCDSLRYRTALKLFQESFGDPSYATPAVAATNAGVCANRMGDSSLAEQWFRAALATQANYPPALLQLASLKYAQQSDQHALHIVEKYLSLRPQDAVALKLAYLIQSRLGNSAAASRYSQRAEQLNQAAAQPASTGNATQFTAAAPSTSKQPLELRSNGY